MSLPTVSFGTLWHVGDMQIASKRRNSYEGAGISVSRNPAAWRFIARGMVDGETWKLTRRGSRFLDAVSLDDEQIALVAAWGIEHGLLTTCTIWRWKRWDDELDDEVHQDFATFDEAAEEAGMDDDEHDISEIRGYATTVALDALTLQDETMVGTRGVIDLVLPIYAQRVLKIDGVWWEERLDPLCHSAPRGVIHADGLCRWKMARCTVDPDEGEY